MLAPRALWAGVGSVDTRLLGLTIPGQGATMAKTHPPSPPAFRAEAVERARTSGRIPLPLAHELGIAEQVLRSWLKRADGAGARPWTRSTAGRWPAGPYWSPV